MAGITRRPVLAAFAVLFPFLAVILFLVAAPAGAARSATIVPCNTPSLIGAISTAVTAGGPQTITLSAGCTYTLTTINNGTQVDTNGLPLITHTVNLTINGSGATIVRDPGAPRFRLFQVGTGALLTLSNLTLAGGYTPDGVSPSNGNAGNGGAILNGAGVVTVTHSLIRGNSTGNGGSCCSVITAGNGGSGGGIYNDSGTVYITDSTLSGNSAGAGGSKGSGDGGAGGGLADNTGTVNVTNSTLSGNLTGSGNFSGTLKAAGFGGGISVNTGGKLNVTNSTIAGNSIGDNFSSIAAAIGLGGGIFAFSGQLTVINTTIANNTLGSHGSGSGGGYAGGATAVFTNTLLAGNAVNNCQGTLAAGSTHNMSDDNHCDASATQKTAAQINLGPLQNNGGPTPTMALRFPSAAIDAGSDAGCPATDQRGLSRPSSLHCDIGAFEFQFALLFLPLVQR